MANNKVYIVLKAYRGEQRISAVFKTKEKAQAFIKDYLKNEKYPFEQRIEEWEINSLLIFF